jgi:DNA-binding response OmpR family regulator
MARILLIDADQGLAPPLREYLPRFDLDLSAAHHPVEGLRRAREEVPDPTDYIKTVRCAGYSLVAPRQ